jgi:hypothetical protein
VRVGLACQQLSGSFSLWLRAMAPLQRPVIEEELQSAQIISDPLAAEKVAPEPTVEILYQGTVDRSQKLSHYRGQIEPPASLPRGATVRCFGELMLAG